MMQLSFTGGRDLTKTKLGVLFIGALTVSTVSIMHVFLPALLWATMIVISTWALFLALASRVGGRRGIATAIMSAALLLVLLIPLGLALGALIDNIDTILAKANSLQHLQLPPPPQWLSRIPLQGPRLAAEWQQLFEQGPGSLSAWISPHAGRVLQWLAAQIGGIGGLILQFFLVVIISAILYVNGES